jgi:hypothetical protein
MGGSYQARSSRTRRGGRCCCCRSSPTSIRVISPWDAEEDEDEGAPARRTVAVHPPETAVAMLVVVFVFVVVVFVFAPPSCPFELEEDAPSSSSSSSAAAAGAPPTKKEEEEGGREPRSTLLLLPTVQPPRGPPAGASADRRGADGYIPSVRRSVRTMEGGSAGGTTTGCGYCGGGNGYCGGGGNGGGGCCREVTQTEESEQSLPFALLMEETPSPQEIDLSIWGSKARRGEESREQHGRAARNSIGRSRPSVHGRRVGRLPSEIPIQSGGNHAILVQFLAYHKFVLFSQ